MIDPTQMSDNFKVSTGKGMDVVEQSLEEMRLPSINIDKVKRGSFQDWLKMGV